MKGHRFHGIAALAYILVFCYQSAVAQCRAASLPPEKQSSSHSGGAAAVPPSSTTFVAKVITADAAVTDDMLKHAAGDKNNSLMYSRTYDNRRFSPLKQINPSNIKRPIPVSTSRPAWPTALRRCHLWSTASCIFPRPGIMFWRLKP